MRKWAFLLLLPLAAACSKEGSPALPVSKSTTSTTAPAGVNGGSGSTSSAAPTSIATSTTTPKGPGIAMTGPSGSSGTLTWSINAGREEFCYHVVIKGAGTAKSASLRHTDGSDIVLTLLAPGADGTVNTCTPSDSITVQQLQSSPSDFYVEVVADKGTLKATLK